MKKTVSLAAMSLFLFTSIACETADDNTIEKARACTDNAAQLAFTDAATAATLAESCDTIITNSGIQTKEANQIRYGVLLLVQQKMALIPRMIDAMKSKADGVDGINRSLGMLVFNLRTNPSADATKIRDVGNMLGGGPKTVGNLIMVATTLNALTGNIDPNNPNPTNVKNAIASCATTCSEDQKTQVASSILSFQQSACQSTLDQNSTDPNNPCFKAKQITGGSTDTQTILNNFASYAATTH